jgi:hypothetical protein
MRRSGLSRFLFGEYDDASEATQGMAEGLRESAGRLEGLAARFRELASQLDGLRPGPLAGNVEALALGKRISGSWGIGTAQFEDMKIAVEALVKLLRG